MIILERFSNKLKQHAIAPKKVYAVDHGLCNFMSFRTSKNAGRVLENVVCIELMRRASYNHGTEVYYWKSSSQKEVDFVVRRGAVTEQLIQVCHDPGDGDTMERETSALLEAGKDLGCRNLTVITDDYKAQKKASGMLISFIPIWEWLLEDPGQNKKGKGKG
jgi:predicted AAA+ superfamily ATPase